MLNSTMLPMTTTQMYEIDDSAPDFANYIGQQKYVCQGTVLVAPPFVRRLKIYLIPVL